MQIFQLTDLGLTGQAPLAKLPLVDAGGPAALNFALAFRPSMTVAMPDGQPVPLRTPHIQPWQFFKPNIRIAAVANTVPATEDPPQPKAGVADTPQAKLIAQAVATTTGNELGGPILSDVLNKSSVPEQKAIDPARDHLYGADPSPADAVDLQAIVPIFVQDHTSARQTDTPDKAKPDHAGPIDENRRRDAPATPAMADHKPKRSFYSDAPQRMILPVSQPDPDAGWATPDPEPFGPALALADTTRIVGQITHLPPAPNPSPEATVSKSLVPAEVRPIPRNADTTAIAGALGRIVVPERGFAIPVAIPIPKEPKVQVPSAAAPTFHQKTALPEPEKEIETAHTHNPTVENPRPTVEQEKLVFPDRAKGFAFGQPDLSARQPPPTAGRQNTLWESAVRDAPVRKPDGGASLHKINADVPDQPIAVVTSEPARTGALGPVFATPEQGFRDGPMLLLPNSVPVAGPNWPSPTVQIMPNSSPAPQTTVTEGPETGFDFRVAPGTEGLANRPLAQDADQPALDREAVGLPSEIAAAPLPDGPPRDTPRPESGIRLAGHVAVQLAEVARYLPDRPVEITLNPEELGRVQMTMKATDGAMVVTLMIERAETADLLRRHIETLSQEFRGMGYTDVSFSFGGGATHHGRAVPAAGVETDTPGAAEISQGPAPVRITVNGGMDIRI